MIPKADLKIDRIRGTGPGGQNRNKVASCIRLTHLPTGIVVTKDGRDQHKNLQMAMRELEHRLAQARRDTQAAERKTRRDAAIKDTSSIRTYDYKSGLVRDHRTGKVASIKDVLVKGKIDLLR